MRPAPSSPAATIAPSGRGAPAGAGLAGRRDAPIRTELERFDGEEIDTAGDGFLALFDGPARAIRGGLAIRDSLAGLGLDVRAGVHTGEVERPVGEKPRGIAVHVGARVMALAGSGEVLVSSTTHDLVAGSGPDLADARPRGRIGSRLRGSRRARPEGGRVRATRLRRRRLVLRARRQRDHVRE